MLSYQGSLGYSEFCPCHSDNPIYESGISIETSQDRLPTLLQHYWNILVVPFSVGHSSVRSTIGVVLVGLCAAGRQIRSFLWLPHHLLLSGSRWCSWFVIMVCWIIRFWSVIVMVTDSVEITPVVVITHIVMIAPIILIAAVIVIILTMVTALVVMTALMVMTTPDSVTTPGVMTTLVVGTALHVAMDFGILLALDIVTALVVVTAPVDVTTVVVVTADCIVIPLAVLIIHITGKGAHISFNDSASAIKGILNFHLTLISWSHWCSGDSTVEIWIVKADWYVNSLFS